jgi:hypothetical protein
MGTAFHGAGFRALLEKRRFIPRQTFVVQKLPKGPARLAKPYCEMFIISASIVS